MQDYLKYVGGPAGATAIGLGALTAAYYLTGTDNVPQCQSIEIPGTPACRRSTFCKGENYIERFEDGLDNLLDLFKRGARISDNGSALGWRDGECPYQWLNYNEVLTRSQNIGSGFIKTNIKPGNDSRIGIYSQNRVEYILTELACYQYSMVIVPLYDTLGPDAYTHIINKANIELVVCDTPERVHKILECYENMPNLKTIVSNADFISAEDIELSILAGLTLLTLNDIENLGESNPSQPMNPSKDDLAVICFTSGTTGTPKGAMISHGNLVSVISSISVQLGALGMAEGDTYLSYLPLAHMYERAVQFLVYMFGGKVGFYRGDVKILMEDLAELKPTLFATVPRLLNRLYDKIMSTVNKSLTRKTLFQLAMICKRRDVRKGICRNDTIWDKLFFSKIRESLGGRCRLITTGSAPISETVLDMLRCTTGAVVLEGYGQTETAAIASLNLLGEGNPGSVGGPLGSNHIKLVDVPDMGYFAADGVGEICFKGPGVFKGYLGDPVKTAEALDSDGWLHSGDVGKWLPNGALKITDRKKNIFKLAQGEYIAPEKIENVYIKQPQMAQMFVHGESLKASLVAIGVPDAAELKYWSEKELNITGTAEELCENKEVKKKLLEIMNQKGKADGLNSFEQVKDIYLTPELFSVENGLLTPTFKAKRDVIKKFFQSQIDDMYRVLQ